MILGIQCPSGLILTRGDVSTKVYKPMLVDTLLGFIVDTTLNLFNVGPSSCKEGLNWIKPSEKLTKESLSLFKSDCIEKFDERFKGGVGQSFRVIYNKDEGSTITNDDFKLRTTKGIDSARGHYSIVLMVV